MKSKKKPKHPKPRVKVAPPSKRHKSVKDYDRKSMGQEIKEALEDVLEQERNEKKSKAALKKLADEFEAAERQWKTNVIESHESNRPFWNEELPKSQNSWVDSFLAVFGFKRSK